MRREKKARAIVGFCACVLIITIWSGCGGGMDVNQSPTSLVICTKALCASTPKTLVLTEGQPRQFFATASYRDGSLKDVTGNSMWSSSNQACATVGMNNGMVSAGPVVSGTCTSDLTASYGPVASSNTTVIVTPGVLETIDLAASTLTPSGGSTMSFTAMGNYGGVAQPQNITNLVTWHTDNAALTILPGSGSASVGTLPGQIVHVSASFLGINSTAVRITVQ